MTTPAGNLLRRAAEIVDGVRNQQHGNKERSFECAAEAWTFWIRHRYKMPAHFTFKLDGADVAKMMQYLKDARFLYGEPLEDHVVDNLGYGAIFGELTMEPSNEAATKADEYHAAADRLVGPDRDG